MLPFRGLAMLSHIRAMQDAAASRWGTQWPVTATCPHRVWTLLSGIGEGRMARYVCDTCGHQSSRPISRCPICGDRIVDAPQPAGTGRSMDRKGVAGALGGIAAAAFVFGWWIWQPHDEQKVLAIAIMVVAALWCCAGVAYLGVHALDYLRNR